MFEEYMKVDDILFSIKRIELKSRERYIIGSIDYLIGGNIIMVTRVQMARASSRKERFEQNCKLMDKKYQKLVGRKWLDLSEEEQYLFTEWFTFEEIDNNFFLVLLGGDEEEPTPILKVRLNSKPDILKTYEEYVEECQIKGENPMIERNWQHETFRDDCICDVMEYNIDADAVVERYF